jgi:hypothetical protein
MAVPVHGSLARTLFSLSFPMLAGAFAMNAYNLTDTWLVARLGTLSLDPQLTRSKPGQRIEPVHRAGELCQNLRQTISPPHMSLLMQQHNTHPIRRPVLRAHRQQHHRPQEPPCHRNVLAAPLHQPHSATHPEFGRHRPHHCRPRSFRDVFAYPRHPADRRRPDQQAGHDHQHPRSPGEQNPACPPPPSFRFFRRHHLHLRLPLRRLGNVPPPRL